MEENEHGEQEQREAVAGAEDKAEEAVEGDASATASFASTSGDEPGNPKDVGAVSGGDRDRRHDERPFDLRPVRQVLVHPASLRSRVRVSWGRRRVSERRVFSAP
jgi:hypothetical protein